MDARRLLIRLPNWLGDVLMARPLLHALRAALPGAEIRSIGTAPGRLLERERLWDAFVPLEQARNGGLDGADFDAALALPPSFSSAWMLWRRGVPRRIGFASDLRSWLLTDAIRRPPRGDLHLSEEYLRLGERLGARRVELPPLHPTTEESAAARERLRALGVAFPHAGPAKRWPPERFAALGRRLAGRGLAVLVAGAAEDRPDALAVATAIGAGAHAIAGETSLGEQLALCATATVTVSNDSGLAHLAGATGAPTVAIFGSTSSAWTAPLGARVRVVQKAPVCSPCFQRTCAIGYRCLVGVGVDDVERACDPVAA